MSSSYPTGLDSLATNKNNTTPTLSDHAQHHNDLADAVNKIEAELGIKPSGSLTDLVTRLGVAHNADGTLKSSSVQTALGGSMPLTNSSPNQNVTMNASGRAIVGADFANSQYWFWNTTSLYQAEALPSVTFVDKTKPAALVSSNNFGVKLVRFGSNVYLQGNDGTTASIWRAPTVANPTTFSWSAALKSYATGALSLSTAFTAGSQYLFAGEYGDPVGGPSLYRSPDGTTWTTVKTFTSTRHIHAVAEDPYNPGTIYVTTGDASNAAWVYRSTDHGSTWTTLTTLSSQGWQAVQISFSSKWVYFASDQFSRALTVYAIDRATATPQWVANNYHFDFAVPGGIAGRSVADFTTTSGSVNVTSAAGAQFTQADVGRLLRNVYTAGNSPVFPDRTFIATVTNATTATVSANATASGTFTTIIEGDRYYGNCYYGAVDPTTERYYAVSNDSSQAGTVAGCFAVDTRLPFAGSLRLISTLHKRPVYPVFIGNSYLLFDTYQIPLPA